MSRKCVAYHDSSSDIYCSVPYAVSEATVPEKDVTLSELAVIWCVLIFRLHPVGAMISRLSLPAGLHATLQDQR